MAVNVMKMQQAKALMKQVDELLIEAGVYETGMNTAASFMEASDDLDMDLIRAESGDFDDD